MRWYEPPYHKVHITSKQKVCDPVSLAHQL